MLPLFFCEQIPDRGDVVIEGDEAHHVGTAARIKVGERVMVTNGRGRRAEVEILDINKRNIGARIIDLADFPRPQTILTVVQALTKGDRARETIELLTEGGAEIIIPWPASRSIGQWKEEKDALSKWKSWAKEATKQARRSWIPEIVDVKTTQQIKEMIEDSEIALMFHESATEKISKVIGGKPPREILLIIGPEGGISDDEAALFQGAGAHVVSMGTPVFRAAHAGVAALAAIQTGYGIW
ncbi:MAG: 16S rRNA (uracil(1498)-N(3))-methyltransferase [Actinobacteria bacterium]|nr:16S rRNA (uracil(1498)-N(3))-methyltransferase [Actinomycetota bacterium]